MTFVDPLKPPFRADHVGSLLRPAELHEARAKAQAGEISADALREVEDRCIAGAIAGQEAAGLRSITDGEFRREAWHYDFLCGLDGIEQTAPHQGPTFRGGQGGRFAGDRGADP